MGGKIYKKCRIFTFDFLSIKSNLFYSFFSFINGLMKSVFLIERSSNFAENFFAVFQHFVSFMELIFAIHGQNRKN